MAQMGYGSLQERKTPMISEQTLRRYKALQLLFEELKKAGYRKNAFKFREITLTESQKDIIKISEHHVNKGIVKDVKAYDIMHGKSTPTNIVKTVILLNAPSSVDHYLTKEDFNKLLSTK